MAKDIASEIFADLEQAQFEKVTESDDNLQQNRRGYVSPRYLEGKDTPRILDDIEEVFKSPNWMAYEGDNVFSGTSMEERKRIAKDSPEFQHNKTLLDGLREKYQNRIEELRQEL